MPEIISPIKTGMKIRFIHLRLTSNKFKIFNWFYKYLSNQKMAVARSKEMGI